MQSHKFVDLPRTAWLTLLLAIGCTNTTLIVPAGDVASPGVEAEPLPPVPRTLQADFDPLDGSAPAKGQMDHSQPGGMKMPMKDGKMDHSQPGGMKMPMKDGKMGHEKPAEKAPKKPASKPAHEHQKGGGGTSSKEQP